MVNTESPLTAKLHPLDNPKLSDVAFVTLREAIISGLFPPGTHLVEQDIAEQLRISRIPVREAIQQLADDGLVVKEPRRGAYVQPYSEADLEEIYSLRIVLERFVIERVMANWSTEAKAQLQAIVDAMVQAAKAGDKLQVSQLDTKFHETLWDLASHNLLLEVVSELRVRIIRFLAEANTTLSPDELHAHAETHQSVLDALSNGAVEAAKTRITEHILGGQKRIKAYYKANYFQEKNEL
jgi:DNA-binding GntR family transcriptional regulator